MEELIKENTEYKNWIISISQQFKASQIKAAVKVNSEMLKLQAGFQRAIVSKGLASDKKTSDI